MWTRGWSDRLVSLVWHRNRGKTIAIDSEDKRRSALGLPWSINLPIADGTISGADKQHAAWQYRGILAAVSAFGLLGDVVVRAAVLATQQMRAAVLGDVETSPAVIADPGVSE